MAAVDVAHGLRDAVLRDAGGLRPDGVGRDRRVHRCSRRPTTSRSTATRSSYLEKDELGLANGIRIGLYRVGMLASGFVLMASDWLGWPRRVRRCGRRVLRAARSRASLAPRERHVDDAARQRSRRARGARALAVRARRRRRLRAGRAVARRRRDEAGPTRIAAVLGVCAIAGALALRRRWSRCRIARPPRARRVGARGRPTERSSRPGVRRADGAPAPAGRSCRCCCSS